MAKFKGKGVVIAGIVAGAASFLRKKENRDKVQEYLNVAKSKVNENGGVQGLMQKAQSKVTGAKSNDTSNAAISDIAGTGKKDYVEETLEDIATTAADEADTALEGNHMLGEGGGQTTINNYNEEQDRRS